MQSGKPQKGIVKCGAASSTDRLLWSAALARQFRLPSLEKADQASVKKPVHVLQKSQHVLSPLSQVPTLKSRITSVRLFWALIRLTMRSVLWSSEECRTSAASPLYTWSDQGKTTHHTNSLDENLNVRLVQYFLAVSFKCSEKGLQLFLLQDRHYRKQDIR